MRTIANQASQRTSVPAFEFCALATLAQNSKAYTAAPAARRYKASKTLTLKRYIFGRRCRVVGDLVVPIRALLASSSRVLNVVLASERAVAANWYRLFFSRLFWL